MSLDVRLTRDVNERWGFELVGGAEDETTLTVQKIQPSSAASRAGLQNGDAILCINGEEAIDFTNEEACRKVAECGETLTFGVVRGLYDPVLDDQEPIYYEPGDLDPQSQPTEVPFKIQQFLEPEDLGSRVINYDTNGDPLGTPFDPSVLLVESRSLTASPFVNPTKPYRPFSTEPILQVPPLEDPIILNPEYKDQFGEGLEDIDPDYILNANIKNGSTSKFKLPISKQYDPNGTRQVKNVEIDSVLSKYTKMEMISKQSQVTNETVSKKICENVVVKKNIQNDSKSTVNNVTVIEDNMEIKDNNMNTIDSSCKNVKLTDKKAVLIENMEQEEMKNELSYSEEMKQDIDMTQIKNTAISVVEDSIEQAVSVTEEIIKEMKGESSTEMMSKTENTITESQENANSIKQKNNENQLLEDIRETEKEQSQEVDKKLSFEEHMTYENKSVSQEIITNNQDEEETNKDSKSHRKEDCELNTSARYDETADSKSRTQESLSQETQTKVETADAQKRTYTIGLQTIPNIRGVVHSSHHYDLLLRTFFIHLTDVMVALSRFVLSQPVFNTEAHGNISQSEIHKKSTKNIITTKQEAFNSISKVEKQRIDESKIKIEQAQQKSTEKVVKPTVVQMKQEQIVQEVETNINVNEKKHEKRELVTPVAFKDNISQESIQTMKMQQNQEGNIITNESKIISGSQMAQRTEKKLSADITHKMDSVISEFQTIAVQGDKKEMFQRNRRSRSKSEIEEEVAKENDPLEWLSKVDNRRASQEISEERLVSKEESSSLEITKKKHLEKHEIELKKYKPPKQMYLAIVEAHVYTNKDVIFKDASEFSETSSVQSAEETNIALESLEAITTENVAIENAVNQIERAKVVEDSLELFGSNSENIAIIRDINETLFECNSLSQKKYKKESTFETTDVNDAIIEDSQRVMEPAVEIKELISKENFSVNNNYSLSVVESSEINIDESGRESVTVETKNESASIDKNSKDDTLVSEFRSTDVKKEIDFKSEVEMEDISEGFTMKPPTRDVRVGEEHAGLKIIKEVETEIESASDIIEVEEELEVLRGTNQATVNSKLEMTKELELDEAKSITEKSVVNAKIGFDKSKVSTSIISSETDVSITGHTQTQNYKSESHISKELSSISGQETACTAKCIDKKLTLRIDLDTQMSTENAPSTIDTPTPSTVPPTPLTDEYVFKLTIPLPKSRGSTPIPRDCTLSPEDEDPHIVKKKLVPHIETTIEKVIYDPPLPTPPADKVQTPIYKIPGLFGGSSKPLYKPVYRKPGLVGGADNPDYSKEEIREIERKSSLLASAIDETIKSIEEYKEEVGIEKNKEVKIERESKEEKKLKNNHESSSRNIVIESQQNGYAKEIIENSHNSIVIINHIDDSSVKIKEIANDKILDSTIINYISSKEDSENKVKEINNDEVSEVSGTIIPKETKESEEIVFQNGTNARVVINDNKVIDCTKTVHKQTEVKENGYIESEIKPVEIKEVLDSNIDVGDNNKVEEKRDPMLSFRPVVFDPETIRKRAVPSLPSLGTTIQDARQSPYITESGEIIGTHQGIVDGLEEPVLDAEVAKELGKPGISEEKIAELISGEAEMLREAHVMGLYRVLNSHMHRADDSSVDFQKIKPMIGSLKDSEVLKALNEELARQKEEQKRKEEKRWTTFLQKPKRPVPKAKFGYHGWTAAEQALVEEPYKVKIVKQAKPKVAPDYKPEDFETGPLPWEERAEIEASLPPVEPEEPILIPEVPEFLESVDPLKESEVPDLEDTGIPLPPPKEPTPPPEETPQKENEAQEELEVQEEVQNTESTEEKTEKSQTEAAEDMENRLAEQLVKSVQSMVDPNATIEQQLAQMRAQLSALAQLPEVIQQSLELVTRQLNKMTHQEANMAVSASQAESQSNQEMEVNQNNVAEINKINQLQNGVVEQNNNSPQENGIDKVTISIVEDNMETGEQQIVQENRRVETPQMTEEDMRMEKMKKAQQYKDKLDNESRQIKQRATPRVGKPKRMFGPPDPDSRPVILPGGRRWRKTEDVYNEQLIAETLQAQSELLQGKTMGFESDLLPYDDRINFMKYEKPPVSLDHLQQSETYKLVHDMDQRPLKRVEMLTPVIAEADYRERCRSMTPSGGMKHLQIPQQFHP